MKPSQFKRLVAEYGKEKAEKALKWFIRSNSEQFRLAVKDQYQFCVDNEFMWF